MIAANSRDLYCKYARQLQVLLHGKIRENLASLRHPHLAHSSPPGAAPNLELLRPAELNRGPASAQVNPEIVRNVVDLPAPLPNQRHHLAFLHAQRDTPCRASIEP